MTDMDSFNHESLQDRQSIRQYLNTLIEGLEKGKLVLISENDNLLLTPAEMIYFSLKIRKRLDKTKLTLKLTWNHSPAENAKEIGSTIQILT